MKSPNHDDPNQSPVAATADPQEPFSTVRRAAVSLVEQLQALQLTQPEDLPALWTEHIAAVQEVVHFLYSGGTAKPDQRRCPPMSLKQQREFGRLLRDKRNAAGLSRLQLARQAQLSDATIKFIETAHNPPSRASLIRLINVPTLQLRWADVPGQPPPLKATSSERLSAYQEPFVKSGTAVIVSERLDFDELGDPALVRRILGMSRHPFLAQDASDEIDFIPLRR